MDIKNKFELQEKEYEYPYHHLLDLNKFAFFKKLTWGLEYYSYVSLVLDYFEKLAKKNKIQMVAEVGCGDGKILIELAKRYPHIFFEGFDLSKKAIMFAKAFSYNLKNIKFLAKDFKTANKEYDLILCIETLEHIPDLQIKEFVANIFNNLKKGGNLIVSVPSVNKKLHFKHYRHYSVELLKKHLSPLNLQEVTFVYNLKSIQTFLINFFLINNFCILNSSKIRKLLIKYYKNFLRVTDEKRAGHILAIFSKNYE